MIISKSNILNTVALNTGTLSSGVIANVNNSNFAKNIVSSSATLTFTFASVGSAQYVALHGLSLPIGCVVTITATGFSKSHTIANRTKNLVFYNTTPSTFGSLQIQIAGAGIKIISYVQAGLASVNAWGTNSGQGLYYFANNLKSRVTSNSRGLPVMRVQEEVSQKLSLPFRNMAKTWVKTDLQDIFTHYNQTGVLSILDYEDENNPDESVAGFELTKGDVKTHNSTKELCNVTLSLRVSA